MRSRTLLVAAVSIAAALVLVSCKATPKAGDLWPDASLERTVAQPAPTPRWPLTGLPAPSQDAMLARVVSVKIENSPAARPQTGLNKADVVYEVIAEGGITRFHTVFQSTIPPVVGPVRSARPPDLYVIQQYHAILAHVGGPRAIRGKLQDRSLYNDMDEFFNPASYWRVNYRAAPHNMYLDIAKLRRLAVTTRSYAASETITGFAFNRQPEEGTPTVTSVRVPMSASNIVRWAFDEKTNLYARSINGKAHKDAVSGKQLTARNVIVIWARITPYPGDTHGVVNIQLQGSGRATVLRGGEKIDGTWEAGTDAPPTFRDKAGNVIELNPGNTWIQVLGTDQKIEYR